MPALLARRLPVLVPDFYVHNIDLLALQTILRSLPVAWATTMIKTWANAWTTSTRMHEQPARRCVFGCLDEPDTLFHYLRCSRLWSSLTPLPSHCTHVASRLVLHHPSRHSAATLVTNALLFNAVKSLAMTSNDARLRRLRAGAAQQALTRCHSNP